MYSVCMDHVSCMILTCHLCTPSPWYCVHFCAWNLAGISSQGGRMQAERQEQQREGWDDKREECNYSNTASRDPAVERSAGSVSKGELTHLLSIHTCSTSIFRPPLILLWWQSKRRESSLLIILQTVWENGGTEWCHECWHVWVLYMQHYVGIDWVCCTLCVCYLEEQS